MGFQMLKIQFFQMALNACQMWFNGNKIAIYFKKLQKIRPHTQDSGGWGRSLTSVIRLGYISLLNTSPKLDICTFQLLVYLYL